MRCGYKVYTNLVTQRR